MDDKKNWIFPENINFQEVSEYVCKFEKFNPNEQLVFDLRNTVNIHSSFIGFLIHAKNHINKHGGNLLLLLSYTVEKILIMLNIIDYFTPDVIIVPNKKSA